MEALKILQEHPNIHLVLVDLMMPAMDGFELIRRVNEFPSFIIAVIISAHTDWQSVRQAMNAGARDFIYKPFIFEDIDKTIANNVRIIELVITEQQERERLMRQNLLLRKAIDTISTIGLTIADQHGMIVYVNPAEATMHGFTTGELIGQRASMLGASQTGTPPNSSIDTWIRETVNVTKDGTVFPVYLMSTQLRDAHYEYLGRVTVSLKTIQQDLAERRKVEEELKQALQIITSSKRARTERFTRDDD
jgi:PAS domain S-box-containing protein